MSEGHFLRQNPSAFASLPTMDELEKRYIEWLLHRFEWNRTHVASIMGIGRSTLYRRMRKHGI